MVDLADDAASVLLHGEWRESNRANKPHRDHYATSLKIQARRGMVCRKAGR